MKKKLMLPILAAVLAFSLAACGESDAASSAPADSSSQTTAEVSSTDSSQETPSAPAESSEMASSKASSKTTSSKKSSKPVFSKVTSSKAVSSKAEPPISKTGIELFQAADKNYQKWTNQAITAKMTQNIKTADNSVSMVVSADVTAMKAMQNNIMRTLFEMKMGVAGQDLMNFAVYSDGTNYAMRQADGNWIKVDKETADEMLDSADAEDTADAESLVEMFEEIKLNQSTIQKQTVETKNGKHNIHFDLKPSAIDELLDQFAEEDMKDFQLKASSFDLVISSANQIESGKITLDLAYTQAGIQTLNVVELDYDFRQIKPDEIVVPDILR